MSDQTERPRYEYDAEEGFFVDNGDLDEDGLGAELVTEEVVALLNAGEEVKAREEAESDEAVVRYVNSVGGRTIHRLWRDTMRDQGRDTIYRDDWDKLALYDQVLDRAIALGLLMDFLGHVSAIVSGRLAASEPPGEEGT